MVAETKMMAYKPYVKATLTRKYNALGLEEVVLEKFHEYMLACAYFYYLIDTDNLWKVLRKAAPKLVTYEQFTALLAIDSRNDYLDYMLLPEEELLIGYQNDAWYLVPRELVYYENENFTEEHLEKLKKCFAENTVYSGEAPEYISYYALQEVGKGKQGKNQYYIPKDLLMYADTLYYEKSPAVTAMMSFITNQLKHNSEQTDDEMRQIINVMKDPLSFVTTSLTETMDILFPERDASGKDARIPFTREQLTEFISLFNDLNNTMRLPVNNGFTPAEMHKNAPPAQGVPSIQFGRGVRDAIQNKEFDPNEFRIRVLADESMPPELKKSILSGLGKAEDQIRVDKKVGRNDPCPCGSGKKYKKCCGR